MVFSFKGGNIVNNRIAKQYHTYKIYEKKTLLDQFIYLAALSDKEVGTILQRYPDPKGLIHCEHIVIYKLDGILI